MALPLCLQHSALTIGEEVDLHMQLLDNFIDGVHMAYKHLFSDLLVLRKLCLLPEMVHVMLLHSPQTRSVLLSSCSTWP